MKILIITRLESTSDTCPILSAVLDKWLHTVAFVPWAFLRPVFWITTLVLLTSLALPAATFTVTTTNDSGSGSLRQAITDANSNAGPDVITFNILGARSIMPGSALPPITDPVVLDGTTQPGFINQPLIELDGKNAGLNANGLLITAGSSTVRGLAINRFKVNGIQLQTGGGNVIEGNFIGLDLTGTTDRGNGDRGILITGSASNRIGGAVLAERNVISGNASAGIRMDTGSAGNLVQGNFIGLDASGNLRIPNGNGIALTGVSNNRIGGTIPGARNIISGNNDNGLELAGGATDNVVEGNYIGLAPTGERFLRNKGRGVYLSDSATVRNLIGGTNAGAGNVIAGNSASGIKVDDKASGNALLGNSIFGNDFGINLGDEVVTPNDPGDADTGPNRLQNYPVLKSAALSPGALNIHGALDSSPHGTFRIELFASDVCDTSGYGEGQIFLGAIQVITDGIGRASFDVAFAIPTNRFHFVTATATDAGNNTSEFSRSVLIGGDGCTIESTFDDPGHGWLIWHNDDTVHSGIWTNAGGNPGGYLSRSDNGGDSKTAFWQAPSSSSASRPPLMAGASNSSLSNRLPTISSMGTMWC